MRNWRPVLLVLLLLAFLAPCAFAQGTPVDTPPEGASVKGFVWFDRRGDGLYKSGDSMYGGVTVNLQDEKGRTVASAVTGRNGAYEMTGLDAGAYRLSVSLPDSSYVFTSPAKGGSVMLPAQGRASISPWFTLGRNERSEDRQIIGVCRASSQINVFAFFDENGNGGRSTLEELLRNVAVEVIYEPSQGEEPMVIAKATTNREGLAQLTKLSPGSYRLRVTLPDSYMFTVLGLRVNAFYNCIIPSQTNVGLSDVFRIGYNETIGMGVGAVLTGGLSGEIWLDKNGDGARASEGGFKGATVTLYSPSLNVTQSVTTGSNGRYVFSFVQPASDYQLTVSLPSTHMFTTGQSLMTNGYSFTQSVATSVSAQSITVIRDIGVMPVTTLTLRLYYDRNANGVYESDELPFAGAELAVIVGKQTVASAVSDAQGNATIPVLRAGDVSLRCTLPQGHYFTVAGEDNIMTAPVAQSVITRNYTVLPATDNVACAGVTLPVTISGRLFEDNNLSGVMDASESGVPGFTVQALDLSGAVVAQQVTNDEGGYSFSNLLPGAHIIRFMLQDPYVFSEFSQTGAAHENRVITRTGEYGVTDLVYITAGAAQDNIDAGIFKAGIVSGYTLLDSDHDDMMTTDGGLEGVKVSLLDENGQLVADYASDLTDDSGYFYIKGILPGAYSLRYELPPDVAFTMPMSNDAAYTTQPFTLAAGDEHRTADVGVVKTATLAGVAWHDSASDGVMGEGETPLVAVLVSAYANHLDIEYQVVTDEDGRFCLSGLRPDEYTVTVTLPDGMVFAHAKGDMLVAAAPRSINDCTLPLAMGERHEQYAIAAAVPASLAGTLFFDADNDGVYTTDSMPLPMHQLTLCDTQTGEAFTFSADSDGIFSQDMLIPGHYTLTFTLEDDCIPSGGMKAEQKGSQWTLAFDLGDGETVADMQIGVLRYAAIRGSVWKLDGAQDGLDGVEVTLYGEQQGKIAVAATDALGAYAFEKLVPGQYYITARLTGELRFARMVDTTDGRVSVITSDGSAVEGSLGTSAAFPLLMGELKERTDVGMGAMGKLGDVAWLDENGNGMQDADEPCMPGIIVKVYQYGQLVAQAVTDEYGRYLIDGLYPGSYTVEVTMHQELKATVHQTEFPLVGSVLPQSSDLTVSADGVIVPSGGRNMNCDFGFTLRKKNKLPAAMDSTPQPDWSVGNSRDTSHD